MAALLSILIPTLPDRRHFLRRLMERLAPQLSDAIVAVPVEDRSAADGGPVIGERRQWMLEAAGTPYICFVDDDDQVSDDYASSVLAALKSEPDVVGFRLRHFTDGALTGLTIHSLSERGWSERLGDDGLMHYSRTPNHLNPVRREMALSIGFAPMTSGEDADYSHRLFERFGSWMREEFIDRYIYDYLYRTRVPVPVTMYDESGRLTREGREKVIREGGSVV